MIQADQKAYLESWAQELGSQANRIRNLIGSAHWLSDGHHKEAILREYNARYLPPHLLVSSGFVTGLSGAGSRSPELDVLIVDPNRDAPLFHQSGICVAAPRCVLAHVQVKSTFRNASLTDALANIRQAQLAIHCDVDAGVVWRGAFFFAEPEERGAAQIAELIEGALRREFAQWTESRIVAFGTLLPTCIACLDQWITFIGVSESGQCTVRLFETKTLSLACAASDLFGAVRYSLKGPATVSFESFLDGLELPPPITRSFNTDVAR